MFSANCDFTHVERLRAGFLSNDKSNWDKTWWDCCWYMNLQFVRAKSELKFRDLGNDSFFGFFPKNAPFCKISHTVPHERTNLWTNPSDKFKIHIIWIYLSKFGVHTLNRFWENARAMHTTQNPRWPPFPWQRDKILQIFPLKILFLTKIYIPAKFQENWLKTLENHLNRFSLTLSKLKYLKTDKE